MEFQGENRMQDYDDGVGGIETRCVEEMAN